ncbi:hypothetical protein H4219_006170 [Mycoemilia scoparia]|uniref:Lipid droplet-associated hydrolase n=1 Tax=Mycoemilia scoparia TaxID=417184 RepID=A0A9W8DMS2_9FUNG|nr:hypothetical protein H4219_006170 [Mycoemilia scoparia]
MVSILPSIPTPLRATLEKNGWCTDTLVWPARVSAKTILIMVPGSPGLSDFYIKFLNLIYKDNEDHLEIITFSHQAQTSFITNRGDKFHNKTPVDLPGQVAHVISVFDQIYEAATATQTTNSEKPCQPRILICAHSIGCYMVQELYKARSEKIGEVFFIFPAVEHIGSTPKALKIRHLRNPIIASAVSYMFELAHRLLPEGLAMGICQKLYPFDNEQASAVYTRMLNRWSAINILHLFQSEVEIVLDLDTEFYKKHGEKFIVYYTVGDGWVTEEHYENMKNANTNGTVILIDKNIRHDFVLRKLLNLYY